MSYNTLIPSSPQWIKVTKVFGDFATAGITNSITIYALTAKQYIHDVKVVPTTAFSGGIIATYTISVGIGGSLVKYAAAVDCFTGNTSTNLVHTPLAGLESLSGSTNILATAVSTVANLNAATAGAVTFYLLISTVP